MQTFALRLVISALLVGSTPSVTRAQQPESRSTVALLEKVPGEVGGERRAQLRLPFEPQAKSVAEVTILPDSQPTRVALPVQGQDAVLSLLDGQELVAQTVSVKIDTNGTSTWVGRLEHAQHDRAGFASVSVADDGSVYGTVSYEERHYQIVTGRDRKTYMVEVDQSLFPQRDYTDSGPADTQSSKPVVGVSGAKTTEVINVLVVYTSAVVSHMGSVSTLISNSMANLNQSASDSGIDSVFHLAHSAQVTYDEANQSPGDVLQDVKAGNISGLLTLRTTYAADLIVMLVATDIIDFDTCGVAETPNSFDSPSQKPNKAFSVVGDTCSTGFYTFNHEVGHNLSARHQRSTNDNTDYHDNVGNEIHPYAHGFINTTGTYFRTIMANGSTCSTTSCTRINYFTNPALNYAGQTLGVSQSDTNNSADNATAIDNYVSTAADYRDSPTSAPGLPASVTVDRLQCYGANDVTWGAASGAVQYYQMDTAPVGTSTWTNQYTGIGQYFALNVGSSQSVRVRACNETGCGSYQSGNQTAQYYAGCL